MRNSILIILFILLTGGAMAQQKKETVRFAALVSAGWLTGESQKIFAYQAIGGIGFKQWFTGIGAAYDQYGYQSIPVFFDVRRYFGNKRSWQPFIYGDAGVNLALYSRSLPRKIGDIDYVKFTPTFYGKAGAGIDKRIGKKLKLNLSAGFSYKEFSYLRYNPGLGIQIPGQDYSQRYNLQYRRYAVRLGLQF